MIALTAHRSRSRRRGAGSVRSVDYVHLRHPFLAQDMFSADAVAALHEHALRIRHVPDLQQYGGAVIGIDVPENSTNLAYSTAPAGSASPMNVMQPYIVRTYWVRTA